jgi:hypothetical protein
MTLAQLEKTLLEYTKGLPKEALQEILDFVQFIRQKNLKQSADSIQTELSALSKSQAIHLEKEFEDYRKLYPLE